MTHVVLVLPPLVESNFGQVYPSTAVLAAFLQERGVEVTQLDLNERFLDHLLGESELEDAAEGAFLRSGASHRAAAAWVLDRLRSGELRREDFRQACGHPGDPALEGVVRKLASPYLLDPDLALLREGAADPVLAASYARFFRRHAASFDVGGSEPLLVGVSAPMGPQLLPSLWLAGLLRESSRHRSTRIVLGGPALSLLAEGELEAVLHTNPALDCVVRYDGELPLHTLVQQLAAGEWVPQDVPGVSAVVEDGVRHVPPAPGPRLDDLPTPAYAPGLLAASGAARLGVTQARGCYWGKCDYCDFVEVYKGSRSYRGRSPERVLEDIEALRARTGITRFRLITESIPPAFARRFSELLVSQGLGIRWSSFAMVDRRFDRELLELMAASGCDVLVVGLESMVTRALKLVHKSADREENVRFLRDAHAAGIRLKVNLIPDLPSTTVEEAYEGLRDLEELAECFHAVSVFGFEPTHSSNVGRDPQRFGFIPISSIRRGTHAQFAANTMQVVDPAMSDDERRRVMHDYRVFAARVNARTATATASSSRSYKAVVPGADRLTIIDLATGELLQLAGSGRGPANG